MKPTANGCGSTVADVEQFFAQHAQPALSAVGKMIFKAPRASGAKVLALRRNARLIGQV